MRTRDLALTAVVVAATAVPVAWTAGPPAVALAVLASAPVLWVHRRPLLVGLVVGLATTALATLYVAPVIPAGPLVAFSVIAASSTPAWRLVAVLVAAAGVTVSLVVPGDDDLATYRYLAVAYAAAYALGANTRARRAQAAAAAARERTRIAREMHDVLTHSVGMMVVQAEAGPLVVRSDPDRAVEVFDAIAATGRGAVARLREVIHALRSPGIDSLDELVTGVASLEVVGEPRPVPPEVDAAVYRIVQEALTNAARHASARSVRVRLRWRERALGVDVVDDGRGPAGGDGFGLLGMRERVAACGGTLRTGPGPGGAGFAVRATLPTT
ncbi:sensor histidine kinase [Saccharothrix syringae]|uniref:histidine kinase n=1 Tax=Saccharothrix syringae TaxID=103733 RepID=A0A5Q0GZA2_SACSY|nr:histidine kinase [Saccharothrix syringae]QFZ18864.1 two-component sensor histidine kinase [Saccharothrix syringae]